MLSSLCIGHTYINNSKYGRIPTKWLIHLLCTPYLCSMNTLHLRYHIQTFISYKESIVSFLVLPKFKYFCLACNCVWHFLNSPSQHSVKNYQITASEISLFLKMALCSWWIETTFLKCILRLIVMETCCLFKPKALQLQKQANFHFPAYTYQELFILTKIFCHVLQ